MSLPDDKHSVLAVDLDGTLLCGDLSFLSLRSLLRRNPLYLLLFPLWMLAGKAAFKHKLATRVDIHPAELDYHPDILEYVQQERSKGRRTILATGSDAALARPIADHLGCFDEVLASDGIHNRTGLGKRAALVESYGVGGYDYIGNSKVDVPVWRDAARVLVATGSDRFSDYVASQFEVERVFVHTRSGKGS